MVSKRDRVRVTLREMRRAVRAGAIHPAIRARAREILAGLPSMDHAAEIAAIWRFVLEHVRYQLDPVGIEHVTEPAELDRQVDAGTAAEDCDGLAVYAGALLESAGLRTRFVVQGFTRDPERLTHVCLEVFEPGARAWVPFDPVLSLKTRGARGLGELAKQIEGAPTRRFPSEAPRMGKLLTAAFGDDCLGSCCASCARGGPCEGGRPECASCPNSAGLGDVASIVGDSLDLGGNVAGNFGPWGQLVGGIFKLGGGISRQFSDDGGSPPWRPTSGGGGFTPRPSPAPPRLPEPVPPLIPRYVPPPRTAGAPPVSRPVTLTAAQRAAQRRANTGASSFTDDHGQGAPPARLSVRAARLRRPAPSEGSGTPGWVLPAGVALAALGGFALSRRSSRRRR
jgi:hypothetical protein